uniref:Uncharacterized protein n=1 Tax=Rhinopithecus bieti TaxID=61621 RepID=A0A2K6JQJ1_RHIBE
MAEIVGVLFMSKVGLRGDRRSEGDEVLDPLRQALDSSMQSHNLYQHPQRLAFHVSAPVASTMQQASPVHSLLPPLGFQKNGAKAESKRSVSKALSNQLSSLPPSLPSSGNSIKNNSDFKLA